MHKYISKLKSKLRHRSLNQSPVSLCLNCFLPNQFSVKSKLFFRFLWTNSRDKRQEFALKEFKEKPHIVKNWLTVKIDTEICPRYEIGPPQ
jgi:hypothetical protein